MIGALHVGFTGTREGMSPKQFDELSEILSGLVHTEAEALAHLHLLHVARER